MLPILKNELKYYFKNYNEISYIYGFFVLLIWIIPLSLRQNSDVLHELAPATFWVAILTSISLGTMNLFQRDADSGTLEIYPQLSTSLYSVMLAKWLAFYLVILPPMLCIIPVFLGLEGAVTAEWPRYALAMAAGTAAISILSSLASVLTVGLERARAVTMVIILPLAAPIIIFGGDYLRQAATTSLWSPSLMFVIAFSIFLLPILCLAGASCIRQSQ